MLEAFTNAQCDIRKWILLYCAEKTVRSSKGDKRRTRKKQLDGWKKSIMPAFKYSEDFKKLNLNWWLDEIKWCNKYSKNYTEEQIANGLLYRLLAAFCTIYNNCPFRTEKYLDNKQFSKETQKLFKKFVNQSIRALSNTKNLRSMEIIIVPLLKEIKNINLTDEIYSASYKLHGKDWSVAKGVAIGGGAGVVSSIFLGPVIGGYIGKMAGLSGAAATSYGLALLGGGSLAAGGLGMAGGSAFIGLGFGLFHGAKYIKKDFVDELNIVQAQRQLPLLLATGRILFENGDSEIPELIHRTIFNRLKKLNRRNKKLKKLEEKTINLEKLQQIQKNLKYNKKAINLYEKAKNMSETYRWVSGYEMYKGVKSWAS